MINIFFDMDGVLAEYRENCNEIDMQQEGYFATLAPFWNVINAFKKMYLSLKDRCVNVYVLTKVYPNTFKYSVNEKVLWKNQYMPFLSDENFIMVDGEVLQKSQAIKQKLGLDIDETCILIDDYNANLFEWQSNGGIAVKYVNGVNDKNKSFIGERLFFTMSSSQIYNEIINLMASIDVDVIKNSVA